MRAILTFHCVDPRDHVLSIHPEELRSLLRTATTAGFALVRLDQLLALPDTARALALTFDDGYRSVHEHARPILRELAAPATVFLVSSFIGQPHDPPTLTWDQVAALHGDGWEIGAHTARHADLRTLDGPAIERELEDCDGAVAAAVGTRPSSFAYPFGYCSAPAVAAVRARYRHAATTRMAWLRPDSDRHRLPRLETFYFRRPAAHRGFGGPRFCAWLWARARLRRLRWGKYA